MPRPNLTGERFSYQCNIRLRPSEHAALRSEANARNLALSELIRERCFDTNAKPPSTKRRRALGEDD